MRGRPPRLLPAGTTPGERLRDARRAQGLRQKDAAAATCYEELTISEWELERTLPPALVALQLADLYGVSLDWIMTGGPAPEGYRPPGESLGERLRCAREHAGKSIVQAAELIGRHRTTLRAWENNVRIMRLHDAYALAQLYRTSVESVVRGEISSAHHNSSLTGRMEDQNV